MNGLLHLQIDVDPRDRAIMALMNAGRYRPNVNNQPLQPRKEISDVWPGQPHSEHLQVFVSRLGGVGRTPVYDRSKCFIRLFGIDEHAA